LNYKNAWKCKNCPQSNKEDGCPAWNEVILTNPSTGEQKIEAGCFFQVMPMLQIESIKASKVATNTAADIKNEIARGYSVIAQSIPEFVNTMAESIEDEMKKKLTSGDVEGGNGN